MTFPPLADPDEHDVPVRSSSPPAWTPRGDLDLDTILERWSNGNNAGADAAIAATVARAAATIEALRRELEEASAWAERADNIAAKEAELGRVIMRAQQFAERAALQAEERARQVIAEAEGEAARIIEAARAHSMAILEDARRAPSLPPEDAHQLQEALQLFSRTNGDLMNELRLLSEALVPKGDRELNGEPRHLALEAAPPRSNSGS